ncbi:MAG: hypothetical protein E6J77_09915 [Deltaproteobacteria bacterium]|nr:MAG: hypothetical protein E6J77_09915 [Deltaproteobacteria bacterium]
MEAIPRLDPLRIGSRRETTVIAADADISSVNSRLAAAAEGGETLEVILVLRGKVRRAAGSGRWRMQLQGRRVLTFQADCVLATTAVARRLR